MKTTQKKSRIRIKNTKIHKERPFLSVSKPKAKKNKKHRKIDLLRLPTRKSGTYKFGYEIIPASVSQNIYLVLSGLAFFFVIGFVFLVSWKYMGAGYSVFMSLFVVGSAFWFFSSRRQRLALQSLKEERKLFLSDYERLVRETARNRQNVDSLKQELIETGRITQRMNNIQQIGANPVAGRDVGARMLETMAERLSQLGDEKQKQKEEPPTINNDRINNNIETSVYDNRFKSWTDPKVLKYVSDAVKNDEIDLFIQPIVNLPQRKRRFYEMYSRIRVENGEYLPASRYIHLAEKHNLLSEIDNLLLLRGLKLIQAADAGNLNRSFFCNVTPSTLNDQKFMGDLLEFVTQYRILAPRLIFELSQHDVTSADEDILNILNGLSRLGCRFSMDRVTDLNIDFDSIQACHIRFVKIPSRILSRKLDGKGGFTQLRRLKDDLDYNGVDLIVEKIETERQVLKLLDIDIDYGQGYLFGEPRQWVSKVKK